MKKTSTILFMILAVLLPGIRKPAYGGENTLFKASVSVDGGKPFYLDSIYPKKKTYIELSRLCSEMKWSYVDRSSSRTIYVENRPFRDFVRYRGQTYVGAKSLGRYMGYKVSVRNNGMVIDYYSKAQKKGIGKNWVTMKLMGKKKYASSIIGNSTYKVTLDFRNNTKRNIILNRNKLYIVDGANKPHYCQSSFKVIVKPSETQRVDRLYFNIPHNMTIVKIVYKGDAGVISEISW